MRLPKFPRRKFKKFRRSPKIFVPTPKKWIVIPFKPASVALIIILFLTSLYLLFRSDLFLVKNIKISGCQSLSEEEVRKIVVEKAFGRSIFFLDISKIKTSIKNHFLKVKDIQIEKHFPNSLSLAIVERKALAIFKDDKENQFLVGEEGVVFAEAPDSPPLPKINLTEQKLSLGEKIESEKVKAALLLLSFLDQKGIRLQKIEIKKDLLELAVEGEIKLLISPDKDLKEQVEILSLLLQKYKIEGKNLKKIDLRFEKPVIEYQ